ncbi:DEAD/DEAH box helicase [Solibacillus sp.]|uniref:DEAD/DEAH box helicase n=1 Tax=Solibacillus sp. TaxID=1909654 RepID=UPI0033157658
MNIFNTKYHDLKEHYESKDVIFIFKGFPHNLLNQISEDKFFDVPLEIDLIEVFNNKKQMTIDFLNNDKKSPKWMTIEEFRNIPKELWTMVNLEPIIVQNNLYNAYAPLMYKIKEEHIDLFDEVKDEKQDGIIDYIYEYYTAIVSSQTGIIYVSYISDDSYKEVDLFEEAIDLDVEEVLEAEKCIELGGEVPFAFLDFITETLNDVESNNLAFSYSNGREISYLEEINLQKLRVLNSLRPNFKIQKLIRNIVEQDVPVEKQMAYKDILYRYWGYEDFRTLKVYKNVDSRIDKKQTIEISQMQIIHDLVQQAEVAKENVELKYRDIFVTAPTGAGKSVMFQVPAIYLAEKYERLTIIISPLIGLMKDQVYNLQEKNVSFSATINSEISPVEKANIAERIASKEVSILYISPETLLSRSDIKALIGDREIGLFVIDEAHIVTTWGKAFRSDYWYLGDYLQKLRKGKKGDPSKKNNFPIATFTATAIYGGVEDMYAETRDSLIMNTPICYFGYVKRDNISIMIDNDFNKKRENAESLSDREYMKIKHNWLLKYVEYFIEQKRKVLIYFPMVKFIRDFKEYIKQKAPDAVINEVVEYYGPLDKEHKNESFLKFKTSDAHVMLATKAFGMGIDIPDIDTVLHFAPTGNVCDYVQEIGRAARALPVGNAGFCYMKEDFKHVNRLHGMGTIKKHQLVQVMQKVYDLFNQHSRKEKVRNLLVSADAFQHIFSSSRDENNDNIDNQLKTALLIIEKGFINSPLKYSPITARPRSLFATEYFTVEERYKDAFLKKFGRYVTHESNFDLDNKSLYKVYLNDLWQDFYSNLTFPNFKRIIYEGNEKLLKDKLLTILDPYYIIKLSLKESSMQQSMHTLKQQLQMLTNIFSRYIVKRETFTVEVIAERLQSENGLSKFKAESMAHQLIETIIQYESTMNRNSTQRTTIITKKEYRNSTTYRLQPSFNDFIRFIENEALNLFDQSKGKKEWTQYVRKNDRTITSKLFLLLGALELLGITMYEVNGGDKPQIHIRVGSIYQIERVLAKPSNYQNVILDNVYKRHNTSVAMLRFLFEKQELTTEQFWEYIEEYFLGDLPEEVKEVLRDEKSKKEKQNRKEIKV